jgi:hypothetical protein
LTAHVGSFFAFAEFAAYVRPGCLAGWIAFLDLLNMGEKQGQLNWAAF